MLRRYGPHARASLGDQIPQEWRSVLSEDDVMQVTYLNAFLHIGEFEARDCKAFVAWLKRIAENNLRNAITQLAAAKRPDPRRRIRWTQDEDRSTALLESLVGPDSTPSRKAQRHEMQHLMADAICGLPEAYQRVVRLYDLGGRNAKEVAASMNRSEGAVYMLRARAHERLREIIGSGSGFLSDVK